MSNVLDNSKDNQQKIVITMEFAGFQNDRQSCNQTSAEPEESSSKYNYPTQETGVGISQLCINPSSRQTSQFDAETEKGRSSVAMELTLDTETTYCRPPRHPDYVSQQQRVASFQTLAIDNKPDPSILAEYGFFFTGNLDLVRCFQCGIGLKDWIKDDAPLTEHLRHSSSCDFLIHKLGSERIYRKKLALTQGSHCQMDSTAFDALQLPYKIRSPRYQTMEARVASFEKFPSNIHIPPQQLAVAGLFYSGNGDLCRCFTCDGGLKDWTSGDDPVKEHAIYFPMCAYIKQLKGEEYVQQQKRLVTARVSSNDMKMVVEELGFDEIDVIKAIAELRRKGKLFPSAEEIVNTIFDIQEKTENVQAITSPQRSENDIYALVEENKRLSQRFYCMLCEIGEADILFLPCTHHRVCHECASVVCFCPICKKLIKEKIKISPS